LKEHPEEDTNTNQELPGFEDVDKGAESEADIGSKGQGIDIARSDEDWQNNKQHTTRTYSHFEMENEEPAYVRPDASINSDTRTKTANFNHNECSIEVINEFTQLTTLGHGINGDMARNKEESPKSHPVSKRFQSFKVSIMVLSARGLKRNASLQD